MHQRERRTGDHAEAHAARPGRRLEARLVPAGLQLLDGGDQFVTRTDPPPRRHRNADRLHRLVGDHLVLENGHRLGRRRQHRRTRRLELGAVRDDRRLVQPGHEHVDAAPRALVQRVLDVPGGGEVLGFQFGGVGGGQHGRVRVTVGRMDLDGPVAGISPQLIHEEHVLRVRAVEPDAYARDHAGRLSRFAGRAEQPVPGQDVWRDTKPPLSKGHSQRWCWGRSYGFGGAPRATRGLRIPHPAVRGRPCSRPADVIS